MTQALPPVEVAVGVVIRADGCVLLGQRPAGKPYAGWWEFPGGKLEQGETVHQALARELHEELGLQIAASRPWIVREFIYPHAHVRLHFHRVLEFSGEPHGREGQAFAWLRPDAIHVAPLLPATVPVIAWLRLATYALWFRDWIAGDTHLLMRIEAAVTAANAAKQALPMVILDLPAVAADRFERLYYPVRDLCRSQGVRLLIGGQWPESFAAAADGVLLGAGQLTQLSYRPASTLVGACCESDKDLSKAAQLGLDFALSKSPPQHAPLPVLLALDPQGMTLDTLRDQAWQQGAHGFAIDPSFWQD